MSVWSKVDIILPDDRGNEMHLVVNWAPGRPAFTKGAPEDCYPADPPQYEILSAEYDDGREVPQLVVDGITDEQLSEALSGEVDYESSDA